MKMAIQIALLCAAAAGSAAAAHLAVEPSRAEDYLFTVPASTNHIRGKVIDPDRPYGVIRSEDVCWTWEALEERAAIANGAMPTGRVARVRGAQVRREHTEFQAGMPSGVADWLDPDAPLIGALPVLYDENVTRTNTWTFADGLRGWTNSHTVISMPMTNGTVSAYTNAWSVLTVTGRVWAARQELAGGHVLGADLLPLPLATNVYHSWRQDPDHTGPVVDTAQPRAQAFREAFRWLRATRRLDDPRITSTNRVPYAYAFRYADGSIRTGTGTQDWMIYSHYACTSNTWNCYDHPDTFQLRAPSRFTSELVTTGGARRVEIEAAYLLIGYEFYDEAYPPPATQYAHFQGRVAARLQTVELDTSGERAVVVATVTPEYLREAGSFAYNLPPMPTGDHLAPFGHRQSWDSQVEGLAVVYKVTPSSRFVENQEGTP